MAKDHYSLLGVSKTATDKEIKTAYRKLAVSEHPDKHGGNPEAVLRFQEINGAYETLRDSDKRAAYDAELSGPSPQNRGSGQSGPSSPGRTARPAGAATPGRTSGFEEAFSGLFSGMPGRGPQMPRSGFPGASRPGATAPTAPPPGEQQIEITLEEAVQGSQKTFRLQVEGTCPDCKGSGQAQSSLNLNSRCAACSGRGKRKSVEEVPVKVPPGITEGGKLKITGRGPLDRSGVRTDLFLKIHIKRHDIYTLEGSDIVMEAPIPFTVMALGGEAEIQTPAGKKTVTIPPGTPSGYKMPLAGQGLPRLGNRPAGDLQIKLKVAVPRTVSEEERRLLINLARLRNETVKGG